MDVLDDEFITHETVRGKARLNCEEVSRYCVEYGDVLFQRSSENQEDAGTSNVYLDQHVSSAFGGFVIRGKKVGEYNPIFIKYLLGSPFIREQITHRAQGAQHINVSQDTLADVVLLMPSMREQEAVGLVFLHLDNLITLHQRKRCNGTFTHPLVWEQRKFSDLSDRVSIQSSDSDLPQVEYENIISGMGMLNKDLRDKEGGKTGIKFYAGDVLYGKLRPYLMNWLYPQFNGVAVGDFWVLRATECDSSFLYRLVQTPSFQRLANVSSGSKMPRADWNLISQSLFAVPADHAEQKAIARSLAELDDLITLHQRQFNSKSHDTIFLVETKNRRLDIAKSAVLGLETRSNLRKLLNEHPIQQRFLSIPQQFKLTLMKGDEEIEVCEATTYLGCFTAAGDCYSKCFNLIGI